MIKSIDIKSIEKIDYKSVHIHFKNGSILCFTENDLIIDDVQVNIDNACLLFPDENNSEILKEKKLYDQRVLDGQNAYLMLMAELRLNSIQNNLPREVNKFIEEKLELVKSQVINGQWISAREKLDLVTVEGFLTQELYDRIQLKLDTYISENY